MKYRTYPNTAITVSDVGFGLWTTSTGWWGNMTDDEAVAIMREAEALWRHAVRRRRYVRQRAQRSAARESAFADRRDQRRRTRRSSATTAYNYSGERKGQQEIPRTISRRRSCASRSNSRCKRLQTDYIDIWQMHNAHLEQVRDGELHALLDDFDARRQDSRVGRRARARPSAGSTKASKRRANAASRSIQMIQNILEPFPGQRR